MLHKQNPTWPNHPIQAEMSVWNSGIHKICLTFEGDPEKIRLYPITNVNPSRPYSKLFSDQANMQGQRLYNLQIAFGMPM